MLLILLILGLAIGLGTLILRIRQSIPDKFPTAPDMIKSNGYPVESHIVQTSQGYLLTMHRIPYGRKPGVELQKDKPVVYLQHGLLTSSADWVYNGPKKGLAYLLADRGFDVWLGNSRGNTFSRKHTNLSPKTSKFWNFSFHDIGVFDLTASIDYILNKTGGKKLTYVGHSQGCATLLVMLSLCPQYNDLINSAHALAPAAFISNVRSPIVRFFGNLLDRFGLLTHFMGNYEMLRSTYIQKLIGHLSVEILPLQKLHLYIIKLLFGDDPIQLNKNLLPLLAVNIPAGCSTKQVIHFFQLRKSGHFRQFDYGTAGNMKRYGSPAPPDYPLGKITAPISLHYSDNDWMIPVDGVHILSTKIPNLIGAFRVPFSKFNHGDYIYAIDVKPLLYDNLIYLIEKFKNNE